MGESRGGCAPDDASFAGNMLRRRAERLCESHNDEERCYWCATEEEMTAAFEGRPHPTIHFEMPSELEG